MDYDLSSSEEENPSRDIVDAAYYSAGFDESFEVLNAEEVESPLPEKKMFKRKSKKADKSEDGKAKEENKQPQVEKEQPAPAVGRKFSGSAKFRNKELINDTETSESEDSDELAIQKGTKFSLAEHYDPKQFENLEVSSEVGELFQNVTRYTPQKIELRYKLVPFIPDYIPAVGDIDAFLKIPRPDGAQDLSGLVVLDEPAADQSEPTVLQLQLRSKSGSALTSSSSTVVKRLDDAGKQGKLIDKWIDDMARLHLTRHQPAVNLVNKFPDIDALLMVQPQYDGDADGEVSGEDRPVDLNKLNCSLSESIDLICALLDIPVYENARIESLHVLFTLYLEVINKLPRNF